MGWPRRDVQGGRKPGSATSCLGDLGMAGVSVERDVGGTSHRAGAGVSGAGSSEDFAAGAVGVGGARSCEMGGWELSWALKGV